MPHHISAILFPVKVLLYKIQIHKLSFNGLLLLFLLESFKHYLNMINIQRHLIPFGYKWVVKTKFIQEKKLMKIRKTFANTGLIYLQLNW